jgi:hypothetical protein
MSLLMKPSKAATIIAAIAFTTAITGCGSGSDTAASAAQTQTAGGQTQGATPGVQGTTPGGRPQGTTPGAGGGPGGGGFGMDTAALAEALGVSEAKVTAAIAKVRPAGSADGQRPTGTTPGQGGTPGQRPDMSAMYKTLADELGVSEAKVQKAFEAQMQARMGDGNGPPNGTPPDGAAAPQASATTQ